MTKYTLDKIVRNYLLNKGYPFHYYTNALNFACDGLRRLTFDTLRWTNTVKLPVNYYYAVDLPCDFVSIVKIGVQVGQYVKPLVKKGTINNLTNKDTSGQPIPYGNPDVDVSNFFLPGSMSIYWGTVMWNENNEQTGRFFGLRGDYGSDTYKIIRERNQIQLDEQCGVDYVILEYVSDGQTVDNASGVHPYAHDALMAYIEWQFKLYGRSYGIGEKQECERLFNNEHRLLRARLNDLTTDDIKRIWTSNYVATIRV